MVAGVDLGEFLRHAVALSALVGDRERSRQLPYGEESGAFVLTHREHARVNIGNGGFNRGRGAGKALFELIGVVHGDLHIGLCADDLGGGERLGFHRHRGLSIVVRGIEAGAAAVPVGRVCHDGVLARAQDNLCAVEVGVVGEIIGARTNLARGILHLYVQGLGAVARRCFGACHQRGVGLYAQHEVTLILEYFGVAGAGGHGQCYGEQRAKGKYLFHIF